MSMRHFFLGDLVLLFSIVAWGRPYGFSDFVRELNSRSSSHLMIVKISKSVRGMYVSKFKKVFMVGHKFVNPIDECGIKYPPDINPICG